MYLVWSLILLVGISSADPVYFEACDGAANNVLTVVIKPCSGKEIDGKYTCVLLHGVTARVAAAFSSPFRANNLETLATATINGQSIPFPESGQNPCKENIFPGCPLEQGELYMFKNSFRIWKFYPEGLMTVSVGIVDSHGKVVACAKVPVFIKRNPQLIYKN